MLSVIIIAIIFVVELVMVLKSNDDPFVGIGVLATITGGVALLTMIVIILCEHIGVNTKIEQNNIEYNALCERYEIVTSDYEDVSKSDVIKDISEWNKKGLRLQALGI